MPMIQTRDGTRLYVKTWGEGEPVVLIHGWPLSSDSWDPISHALAETGFKAIAYDRRGFGRSDQPSGGYDYDTFADDLGTIIENCCDGREAALVGFSMGGGEVARYLSRHGGKGVSKAALIGSIVPYMLQTDDNPHGVPQATFDQIGEGLLADRAAFFTDFFKDFYGVGWVDRRVSDEVLQLSWITAMQAGLRPTLAAARAFGSTDFRPDLAHFKVPTLIIHGTGDRTVPIDSTAREVAKAVPHAQLIEYGGEAHGLLATQAERLKADLLDFLGGGSRGAFAGLEDAPPEARQDIIDEATRQSLVTPVV